MNEKDKAEQVFAIQIKQDGNAKPPTHYVIHDRQHCPNRYDPLGGDGQRAVIAFGTELQAIAAAKAFVERAGGYVTIVEAVRKVHAKARVENL